MLLADLDRSSPATLPVRSFPPTLVKRLTSSVLLCVDRNEDPTVNAREVVLSKGKNGLGMTLAGSNPVIVMRIDPSESSHLHAIAMG